MGALGVVEQYLSRLAELEPLHVEFSEEIGVVWYVEQRPEAQHVGLQLQVREVQDLAEFVEFFLALVGVARERPVLVDVGLEVSALQRQQLPRTVVLVEDDLEACLPVDASLHLGHKERQVHVDRLVELVYLLLDVPVLIGVFRLYDGLVAGGGSEIGVRNDALPYELVLPEPTIVLIHAPVVCAGGGGAGLAL